MENPAARWNECLNIIRDNITQQQFDTWFGCMSFNSFEENTLKLNVPGAFVYEFVEAHYLDLLKKTITKVYGPGVALIYSVLEDKQNDLRVDMGSSNRTTIPNTPSTRRANVSPDFLMAPAVQDLDSRLNPNNNFENFIVGKSNKLCFSVGESIAKTPSQTFNPLFVYGASGVGKTHLVNAIGLRAKELHPSMRVLYVSAHLFYVQYADAARNNKTPDFIQFYQTIDLLIIDDIQEFSGREKTQQTFFHIFNHLRLNGKQIILTADRPPVDIEGLEDRLLTRFKWGLQAELLKPDRQLRRDILSDRIRKDGLTIPTDIIDVIADRVTENIRELEGIINSLLAYSVVWNRDIDMELLQSILPKFVDDHGKEVSVGMIKDCVCEKFNIDKDMLTSTSRKQPIAYFRQLAIYLTSEHTNLSTNQIGKEFGNRNHATIIYSINQVKNLIETDTQTREDLESLRRSLLN